MVFKTTHKPEGDVIMNLQVGNWELTCTELSPVSVEHHPIQDPIFSSLHLILLQSGKQLFFWVYSQVENLKLERSNAETKTAESALFLLLTHFVVATGVEKGIERYSKIMMPMLLVIILVLAGFSMMMPNAIEGVRFLLTPDFSKVTKDVVLSAMGQAFFSLSVGMGTLATYASYFNKETKLVPSAIGVCTIDTLVAISAGFIIFPAVFSVGVSADSGPGLVFITLPYVFQEAFGSVPVLEYVFSGLFYILLLLAALTSSISMHEISTAYIHETFKISRPKAATIVTAICFVMAIACSLSFGLWKEVTFLGKGFFDLFDFITAKFLMPLGGLLICTFVGWDMNKKLVASELNSRFSPLLMILFSWVAPIGIGIIFVYGLISG